MAGTNPDVLLHVGFDIDKFNAQLNKTTGMMNKWRVGMLNALKGAAAGFSAFQITRHVITQLAAFEKQMSTVKAITGATAVQFKMLRDNAISLGNQSEYTATQIGALQTEFGRLGFTTQEILDATKATMNLATATGEDLAKSALSAGSTLRGFNLATTQTEHVTDVMAAAFNRSALALDSWTDAIKYVAPIAAAANVSLEDTAALLSVLADAGIKGSQAGTSLRRIISELEKSGRPLTDRLKELAERGITLANAEDEVGIYAKTALIVLERQVDTIGKLSREYHNVNGETQRMADIMRDNLTGDWQKFTSLINSFIVQGSALNNVLREIVQGLTFAFGGIVKSKDLPILINQVSSFNRQMELMAKYNREPGNLQEGMLESMRKRAEALNLKLIETLDTLGRVVKVELRDTASGMVGPMPFEIPKLPELKAVAEETKKNLLTIGNLEEQIAKLKERQRDAAGGELLTLTKEIGKLEDKLSILKEFGTLNPFPRRGNLPSFNLVGDIPRGEPGDPLGGLAARADAIKNITTALTDQVAKSKEATDAMAAWEDRMSNIGSMVMNFSTQAGMIFEELASGTDKASHVLARAASAMVQQVGRMIMAEMVLAAIRDKATNFNFFAKLALIGVAIGTASSLLNRIGAGGGGGGVGTTAVGTPGERVRLEQMGARVQLEPVKIEITGPNLTAWLKANDRYNSRTRPGG